MTGIQLRPQIEREFADRTKASGCQQLPTNASGTRCQRGRTDAGSTDAAGGNVPPCPTHNPTGRSDLNLPKPRRSRRYRDATCCLTA